MPTRLFAACFLLRLRIHSPTFHTRPPFFQCVSFCFCHRLHPFDLDELLVPNFFEFCVLINTRSLLLLVGGHFLPRLLSCFLLQRTNSIASCHPLPCWYCVSPFRAACIVASNCMFLHVRVRGLCLALIVIPHVEKLRASCFVTSFCFACGAFLLLRLLLGVRAHCLAPVMSMGCEFLVSTPSCVASEFVVFASGGSDSSLESELSASLLPFFAYIEVASRVTRCLPA